MVRSSSPKGTSRVLLAVCGGLCLAQGRCVEKDLSADPMRVPNPLFGPMTVAVAPALNFSGSSDFDRNRVADLMTSELGHVDGIKVIPVSRVLAVLAQQGRREVGSPSHALEICQRLGADAILVFAVTEYDPYDPPTVGIAAQLYGQVPGRGPEGDLDPILVSRQARAVADSPPAGPSGQPVAQTQRVFNATHDYVVQQIKRFARRRDTQKSPYGWRLYLVSQEHYLRFCCSATLQALLDPSQAGKRAVGRQGEVRAQ
jgi:hypothetical protein